VLRGEAHVGQHVGLGVVHQDGELRELGAELVGDVAPLLAGSFGVVLGEGGGHAGRHDAPPALAGVRERVAQEVDAAALPGRAPRTRAIAAFSPSWASEITSFTPRRATSGELAQELGPERLGLGGAMSIPSTSRRPSVLTSTAMITATDTMRPFWRTFT
jgi:hypothetical protein